MRLDRLDGLDRLDRQVCGWMDVEMSFNLCCLSCGGFMWPNHVPCIRVGVANMRFSKKVFAAVGHVNSSGNTQQYNMST